MIIRFGLENFLSFNSNQSISMVPGNARNKSEHVFEKDNLKLLNLSANFFNYSHCLSILDGRYGAISVFSSFETFSNQESED